MEIEDSIDNKSFDTSDDPVVSTIDVYLSQTLADNLHLFQYPNKTPQTPLTADDFSSIRIRPNISMIEMDYSIGTDPRHVNLEHSHNITQLKYKGEKLKTNTTFAVGLLCNNSTELHLTPLPSIYQLRPSYDHLNESNEVRMVDEHGEELSKEAIEALQRSKESVADREARLRYLRNEDIITNSYEPWVSMALIGRASADTHDVYNSLISEIHDDMQFNLPIRRYITKLFPPFKSDQQLIQPPQKVGAVSQKALRRLSLKDQIKHVLINTQVIDFATLKKTVALKTVTNIDAEIINHLTQLGVLVQGNWVCRSNLSVQHELVPFRDYLLYLFEQDRFVSRRKFAEDTKLPPQLVRELLSQLSIKKGDDTWELKRERDQTFLENFSFVHQDQQDFWRQYADTLLNDIEAEAQKHLNNEQEKHRLAGKIVGSQLLAEFASRK